MRLVSISQLNKNEFRAARGHSPERVTGGDIALYVATTLEIANEDANKNIQLPRVLNHYPPQLDALEAYYLPAKIAVLVRSPTARTLALTALACTAP
jgi:hypothetical protein